MEPTLGGYELRGELGRGAMAVVWRAWDPKLEREVAIKEPVFPPGSSEETRAQLGERFVREGRAAAHLNYPGIVVIYGADVYDGRPAIVMEVIDGSTLSSVIACGAMSPDVVAGMLDQLLAAVGFAHEHGVVHRDIKPDNVFVTTDGRVKLTDFGIAKVGVESTMTQMGTVMGTPGYMSPEQVVGQSADARSDLFAIGVVAYEMLSGHNPFGAGSDTPTTTVMYRIAHEEPPEVGPLTSAPAYLSGIIAKAMAKDPAARYASAAEMRADLLARVAPVTHAEPVGGPDADPAGATILSTQPATIISGPETGTGPATMISGPLDEPALAPSDAFFAQEAGDGGVETATMISQPVEDAPHSGRRGILIAAALAAVVLLLGGLAYMFTIGPLRPVDAAAEIKLGNDYFDKSVTTNASSDRKAAIEHYSYALRVQPDNPDVRTDMAIMEYREGQVAEAIKDLRYVREHSPEHLKSLLNLARFLWSSQDTAGAKAAYQEIIDRAATSDDPEAAILEELAAQEMVSGPPN